MSQKQVSPSAQLIVALDFTALAPALRMARQLQGLVRTVKVGSALFTSSGPAAVQRMRDLGFGVMLDLKFFDIPSTVELSCRAAARLGASLVTVHALGQHEMLKAAVHGVRAGARRRGAHPRVLAVTRLTSVSPGPPRSIAGRRASGGQAELTKSVVELAAGAFEAGCDGVVASAQEAIALRRAIRKPFVLVCPGVRPKTAPRDDQRRITTPAEALAAGADHIVVGRPITEASNARRAAKQILEEMEGITGC